MKVCILLSKCIYYLNFEEYQKNVKNLSHDIFILFIYTLKFFFLSIIFFFILIYTRYTDIKVKFIFFKNIYFFFNFGRIYIYICMRTYIFIYIYKYSNFKVFEKGLLNFLNIYTHVHKLKFNMYFIKEINIFEPTKYTRESYKTFNIS